MGGPGSGRKSKKSWFGGEGDPRIEPRIVPEHQVYSGLDDPTGTKKQRQVIVDLKAAATRHREMVADLFPAALATIKKYLTDQKTPRNIKFECAKLIWYQHLGRPTQPVDAKFEGSMTHEKADAIARADAEARKAFKDALEDAEGLESLDKFMPEELRAPAKGKGVIADVSGSSADSRDPGEGDRDSAGGG